MANQNKTVNDLGNKLFELEVKVFAYQRFVTELKLIAQHDKTISDLVDAINEVSSKASSALKNFKLYSSHHNNVVTQEMEDYIDFFENGLADDSKKKAIKKNINVDLTIDIQGTQYDLNLKTLETLQKDITVRNTKTLAAAGEIQKISKYSERLADFLDELGEDDDPPGRTIRGKKDPTIAAIINNYEKNYEHKNKAEKKELEALKELRVEIYRNLIRIKQKIESDLNDVAAGKKKNIGQEVYDAMDYMNSGNLQTYQLASNLISTRTTINNQVFGVNMPDLRKQAGKTDNAFRGHNKMFIKFTRKNIIKNRARNISIGFLVLGTVIGMIFGGIAGGKKQKAEELNPVVESQQQQINDADETISASVEALQAKVSGYKTSIEELINELNAASVSWGARIGGEKALERLKAYTTTDVSNRNENLNELLAAVFEIENLTDLEAVTEQAVTADNAYNKIVQDLNSIESSVGGYKDIAVSSETIKAISEDSWEGWKQAFTPGDVLAMNIMDIRTTYTDGESSALVQIVFQKTNGEQYIAEAEVDSIALDLLYLNGSLSAGDISSMLKTGKVANTLYYYNDYSKAFGTGDKIYLYGVDKVLAGKDNASVEYIVYAPDGTLQDRGEVRYNNVSQNASEEDILRAVETAIYGQNDKEM